MLDISQLDHILKGSWQLVLRINVFNLFGYNIAGNVSYLPALSRNVFDKTINQPICVSYFLNILLF